jgi:hypothetical protein
MIDLPRLRPEPIPAIHPLPEYAAEGEVAARYADTKAVLQVPWMGVVTMAFAHYPSFFGALWGGTAELCRSRAYIEAARALRAEAEAGAAALVPPPIAGRLGELGYGVRELDDIRAMIEIFSHGNHLYFQLALIARLLLEGGEWDGRAEADPFEGRHAPAVDRPFLLMEAHHADGPTRAVYDDIKATLGLPFVNTDYRALARWPSYFALAWSDLRGVAGGPEHEARCQAVHDRGLELLEALPNPAGLTSAELRSAAEADAPLDEIIACTRLFAYLLPGLTVNVAFLRQQLAER